MEGLWKKNKEALFPTLLPHTCTGENSTLDQACKKQTPFTKLVFIYNT